MLLRPVVFCFLAWKKSSERLTFSNGLSGQLYASWSKPCQVILAPNSSTLGQAD